MESGFVTFTLILFTVVHPSLTDITDWDDVVVIKESRPITLVCTDTPVKGPVKINWKFKESLTDKWRLILSASEGTEILGMASKPYVHLKDPDFINTGNYSLFLRPRADDIGLYSCLIGHQKKKQKETLILLAVLSVIFVPPSPVPLNSTLRLIAKISPSFAIVKFTWVTPGTILMRSENFSRTDTVTKLPGFQKNDSGSYVCVVQAWTRSRSTLFAFNVDVNVDVDKVSSFTTIQHGPTISTGTQIQTLFSLTCPSVSGDYVQLYWVPHDTRQEDNMRLVYQYDRWRNSTLLTEESKRFQLAGPPHNTSAGIFSFRIKPKLRDGGLYVCRVFLNDNIFSQSTLLSILRVKIFEYPSKLELACVYTERSHVHKAVWRHHDERHKLQMFSNGPGTLKTSVPLPITPNTTGNYSCILHLKNGKVIRATQDITLPFEGDVNVTTPSMLPSLSALLLLVPLVAAAVGVLLWRRKHISDRGIEQSLSVHLSETENIYENPDVRKAPPQGSIYMDLKPRGEDDIYKELERYEQCQN